MNTTTKMLLAAALAGAVSARTVIAAEGAAGQATDPAHAEKASCKGADGCQGHDGGHAEKASCKGKDGCQGHDAGQAGKASCKAKDGCKGSDESK